jgi:hypothetical protein
MLTDVILMLITVDEHSDLGSIRKHSVMSCRRSARREEYISAKFQALNIGHAAINSYTYKDNRDKGRRSLPVKTV